MEQKKNGDQVHLLLNYLKCFVINCEKSNTLYTVCEKKNIFCVCVENLYNTKDTYFYNYIILYNIYFIISEMRDNIYHRLAINIVYQGKIMRFLRRSKIVTLPTTLSNSTSHSCIFTYCSKACKQDWKRKLKSWPNDSSSLSLFLCPSRRNRLHIVPITLTYKSKSPTQGVSRRNQQRSYFTWKINRKYRKKYCHTMVWKYYLKI